MTIQELRDPGSSSRGAAGDVAISSFEMVRPCTSARYRDERSDSFRRCQGTYPTAGDMAISFEVSICPIVGS